MVPGSRRPALPDSLGHSAAGTTSLAEEQDAGIDALVVTAWEISLVPPGVAISAEEIYAGQGAAASGKSWRALPVPVNVWASTEQEQVCRPAPSSSPTTMRASQKPWWGPGATRTRDVVQEGVRLVEPSEAL